MMALFRANVGPRLRKFVHCVGFSCIGGSIFLQILVFTDIITQGYFMAVEKNSFILTVEVILTFFALIYFLYVYQRFIRTF